MIVYIAGIAVVQQYCAGLVFFFASVNVTKMKICSQLDVGDTRNDAGVDPRSFTLTSPIYRCFLRLR